MVEMSYYTLDTILRTATLPVKEINVSSEEQTLKNQIAQIEATLKQLNGIKSSDFLPIEAAQAMKQVQERIKKLNTERTGLSEKLDKLTLGTEKDLMKRKMHIAIASAGYPQQLDLIPLKAAKTSGPVFMVSPFFNRSGVVKITLRMNNDARMFKAQFDPKLPAGLEDCMWEACAMVVQDNARRYSKIVLSATFSGWAGTETKKVMEEVKKAQGAKVFDQILVIAEAPKWEIGETRPQEKLDPLVVGWVEKTGQMFLITSYNQTPLERYFEEQGSFGVTIPDKK
jgi:hypothetical protein